MRWRMGDIVPGETRLLWAFLPGLCLVVAGCGDVLPRSFAPLFAMPLTVDEEPVGTAIVDTGGGFEVMLKDPFGLDLVDTAEVLSYSGYKRVDITEPFPYSSGGYYATAHAAIVGLSLCDCNGLGFFFFRKTGAILAMDFAAPSVDFVDRVPDGGIAIPFSPAPAHLPGFDTSFVDVEIHSDGQTRHIVALLDTGSTVTVMRRGLIGTPLPVTPNDQVVAIAHEMLGEITMPVSLFETEGLPDMILGNDSMRAWGDQWYFSFAPEGGVITVIPVDSAAPSPADGRGTQ